MRNKIKVSFVVIVFLFILGSSINNVLQGKYELGFCQMILVASMCLDIKNNALIGNLLALVEKQNAFIADHIKPPPNNLN